MSETVKVIKCPYCGDMWILEQKNPPELCHCFRCEQDYTSVFPINMERWIYELCKKVKGN